MYKIITVSNFNLENYRQTVVAEHISNKELGGLMVKALQATVTPPEGATPWPDADGGRTHDYTYYALVAQGRPLWLGMEEFADNTCEQCGADLYGRFCCLHGM